ncbi:MAG: response regulator [bacterium]
MAKILVVDDTKCVREFLRDCLAMNGYEVVVAEDGFGALNFYKNSTNKPDLVITDLQMPGMSGIQLIEKIKKIKPNQACIAMSGDPSENAIEWLSEAGVRLLRKPINFATLFAILPRVLSSLEE